MGNYSTGDERPPEVKINSPEEVKINSPEVKINSPEVKYEDLLHQLLNEGPLHPPIINTDDESDDDDYSDDDYSQNGEGEPASPKWGASGAECKRKHIAEMIRLKYTECKTCSTGAARITDDAYYDWDRNGGKIKFVSSNGEEGDTYSFTNHNDPVPRVITIAFWRRHQRRVAAWILGQVFSEPIARIIGRYLAPCFHVVKGKKELMILELEFISGYTGTRSTGRRKKGFVLLRAIKKDKHIFSFLGKANPY